MSKEKEKNLNQPAEELSKSGLVLRFLKGSKRYFVISILMAALSALADMISPQIIRIAVDAIEGAKTSSASSFVQTVMEWFGGFEHISENLLLLAGAILLVGTIKVVSQYFFRVANTMGSETLVKTMRDSLFSHIERLPFSWHSKNQTGDIIQRCTSDIDTTRNFVSEQLTSIFRIAILLIFAIGFMISMNWKLTLIAMIPIPVIIWYSMHFHTLMGKGFAECDRTEGILSAMAQENLTGVRVVRAFGRERYEKDRFRKKNEEYTGLWVNMAKMMSRFWCTSDVLSGVQIMLVIVFGAVFCVLGDGQTKMTAGEYIAFVSYNSMMSWPIRQLGRMISEMSKAGVSIDRIGYIMNSKEEEDKPNAVTPALNGDICFEHVNFNYENCPEILHDINFTIKAGSTLGIIGGTGSGKSTLMLLLDRLYDLPEGNGKITIGGVDIRDMKAEHLRKNIGIVLQEPFLFSRTLSENIGITQDGITLTEIREAAKAACLDETIDKFSKGYDTFVGERGVTLSGGQKQRAAIARTLTQNTPIMIFDDSLSAVDTETDARIRKSLESRFGSATIILISHRITTLSKADQIIVLDHGRIEEMGTPDELKARGGLYSRINQIQSCPDDGEEVEA